MENKNFFKQLRSNDWLVFLSKTIFYSAILLALVYLYHFSAVGGGSFIYNQF